MGVVEGAGGQPTLGLLDQASALDDSEDPRIEGIPASEALRSAAIDAAALTADVPDVANALVPSCTLPWIYIGAAVALVAVVLVIGVAFALRRSHAANMVEALRADAA